MGMIEVNYTITDGGEVVREGSGTFPAALIVLPRNTTHNGQIVYEVQIAGTEPEKIGLIAAVASFAAGEGVLVQSVMLAFESAKQVPPPSLFGHDAGPAGEA